MRSFCLAVLVLVVAASPPAAEPFEPKPIAARSPDEQKATFQLAPGFRIELVAAEPQVQDPVAMAFDHDGRLYVAEMRGYPNDGNGTGTITSGCIKLLDDRDGDGVYETATVFADGLRFPTSIQPWKKGILVSVAPDLIYLEDTDGDAKADVKKILYTGFGIDNIQQLLNGVQWGLDNWMYACNGASGGTITSPERPDMKPLTLGNRGIRFRPDEPGSLEPMSGGGQFGLAADAGQHWFTATNSEHIKQIVLPDHYLRRNPGMAAPATTPNLPEHGPACKVFRISPFEQWRVERTTRRAGAPDSSRYAKTELVPGGFVTSACSPLVYEAGRFPAAYRGSVFICEPANNLILRDVLHDDGAIFRATRGDAEREFLASTDNWFRPVNLHLGPDGAMYVVDFYREVIETPRSLPDDMKPKLVLKTQGRGRIWRVAPNDRERGRVPRLSQTASSELVPLLADDNPWWRLPAQRLLVERQDKSVLPALALLARKVAFAPGRVHALWTLHGLNSLTDQQIVAALKEESALVREQALRLAESRLDQSSAVRTAAVALADDPSPKVRFQASFSLGESTSSEAAAALGRILRRDASDPWTTAAVLSSTRRSAPTLLTSLMIDPTFARSATAAQRSVVARLASQVGANGTDADVATALMLIASPTAESWRADLLGGLGQGLQNTPRPLSRLWKNPPDGLKDAVAKLRPVFDQAAEAVTADVRPLQARVAAARLLAHGPAAVAVPALSAVLLPQHPDSLQLAAVRTLAGLDDNGIAPALVKAWASAGPVVRREIQEALFSRADRAPHLLNAIEAKAILPQQLDAARIAQLRKLPDPRLRERAVRLLAGAIDADRQKVIALFQNALDLKADPEKGRLVFRKVCATCHRLEDVGTEVGPDLRAALRDKTPEQLLVSILDPSREVDRRFTNYLVETKGGRSLSGMIAAESATGVTLRRAEKAEDTVLRGQIESIADTGKSLMPDGLEKDLDRQAVADVIAYLRAIK